MSGEDRDRLLAHTSDGIEEYDNPLPGWWVWVFWATIIFSLGYWVYYQLGPGPSVIAEYERDVRLAAARQPKTVADGAPTDDMIAALTKDARVMGSAKQIFVARCSACHGAEGQGIIGPNLTDDYWLHGGRPTEILRTITYGEPQAGMIPWKDQLKPEELAAMAAYVLTLQGTKPANSKAPDGVNAKGERAPGSTHGK